MVKHTPPSSFRLPYLGAAVPLLFYTLPYASHHYAQRGSIWKLRFPRTPAGVLMGEEAHQRGWPSSSIDTGHDYMITSLEQASQVVLTIGATFLVA